MTRWVINVAAAIALLLSCTPTEPCACPPARTSVILYGEVRTADGTPASGARLEYEVGLPGGGTGGAGLCEFNPTSTDVDPRGATADAAGRFRTRLSSGFSPGTRCVQVTASASADSARVEGLLLTFRDRPDSVGLILTLR